MYLNNKNNNQKPKPVKKGGKKKKHKGKLGNQKFKSDYPGLGGLGLTNHGKKSSHMTQKVLKNYKSPIYEDLSDVSITSRSEESESDEILQEKLTHHKKINKVNRKDFPSLPMGQKTFKNEPLPGRDIFKELNNKKVNPSINLKKKTKKGKNKKNKPKKNHNRNIGEMKSINNYPQSTLKKPFGNYKSSEDEKTAKKKEDSKKDFPTLGVVHKAPAKKKTVFETVKKKTVFESAKKKETSKKDFPTLGVVHKASAKEKTVFETANTNFKVKKNNFMPAKKIMKPKQHHKKKIHELTSEDVLGMMRGRGLKKFKEELDSSEEEEKIEEGDFPDLSNAFGAKPKGPSLLDQAKKVRRKVNYKTYNPWKDEEKKEGMELDDDDKAMNKKLKNQDEDFSQKNDSESVSFVSNISKSKKKNWKKKNRGGKAKKEEEIKKKSKELYPTLGGSGNGKSQKTVFEQDSRFILGAKPDLDQIIKKSKDEDDFPGLGDGGKKKKGKKKKKKKKKVVVF